MTTTRSSLSLLESTEGEVSFPEEAFEDDRPLQRLRHLKILRETPTKPSCDQCDHMCRDMEICYDDYTLQDAPPGTKAAVICPIGVWVGARSVDNLPSQWNLKREDLIRALRAANPTNLRPPSEHEDAWITTLTIGAYQAQVFLAPPVRTNAFHTLRGFCKSRRVVLVTAAQQLPSKERDALQAEGIVVLSVAELLETHAVLQLPWLWDRLLPDVYGNPNHPDWVAPHLTLEFAEEPNKRHIVRLNGQELPEFAESDLHFALLVRLAVARVKSAHKGIGKLSKEHYDVPRLTRIRERLDSALAETERYSALYLVRSTGDGFVYLAMRPENIRFDASLRSFQLLQMPPKRYKEAPQTRVLRAACLEAADLIKESLDDLK